MISEYDATNLKKKQLNISPRTSESLSKAFDKDNSDDCLFLESDEGRRVTPENKTRINTTFETIDLKLSNLSHELEDFYDKETKPLRDSLKEKYMDY